MPHNSDTLVKQARKTYTRSKLTNTNLTTTVEVCFARLKSQTISQIQRRSAASVDLYDFGAGLTLDITAPVVLALTAVVDLDLT